ncbi:hypothetical protein [Corallococcus sp. CA054B]|uniref:ApeA N-terminal domain 1-containing protein n=1 Tax=Corallococcus sp. CA054B TaxID=2316734 RepID=UPI0011C48DDC|nr:hypothetical protein [Corallococcus sp. CA054B]
MNTSRYRGTFWLPGELESTASGHIEITESGEITLEIQGDLSQDTENQGLAEEIDVICGQIADHPSGGSILLFKCLKTYSRFGQGGTFQKWFAHRALIGQAEEAEIEIPSTFTRVFLTLDGLAEFIGRPPSIVDNKNKLIRIDDLRFEAGVLYTDDWTARFEWTTQLVQTALTVNISRQPRISISLNNTLTLSQVLEDVVPIFECLITLARRDHARVLTVSVQSKEKHKPYEFIGAQLGTARTEKTKSPRGLLFHLGDIQDKTILHRLRDVFTQHRDFTAIFMSYERSPSPYIDDRVRASIVALAHLTWAFPDEVADATHITSSFMKLPLKVQSYLPSAGFLAIPSLANRLLTPAIRKRLRIGTAKELSTKVDIAFRWVCFREGEGLPGNELLRLNHQLTALLHLALLQAGGFAPSDAEARLIKSFTQLGF